MKMKGMLYLAQLLWLSFRDRKERRAVREKWLIPAPDKKWLMEETLRVEQSQKVKNRIDQG